MKGNSKRVIVALLAVLLLSISAYSAFARNETLTIREVQLQDINNQWIVDSGTAILKLLGTEVLSIVNYGWGVYWNFHNAVLENVYQAYIEQAYIGDVVISNNYVAGMNQYIPFVISGRAGVAVATNGVILESENSTPKPLCVNEQGTIILC